MKSVEYRPIPGFVGYRAGSDGSIWSCLKSAGRGNRRVLSDGWHPLKPEHRKEDGRARHTLRHSGGKLVRRYRSYFVLLAFVGPCPPGMECCHSDGNCLNDSAANLRWDTSIANKADMKRHGTQPHGEGHCAAKLLDDDIPKIIELRNRGRFYYEIGDKFGVTATRIYQICKKGAR